MTSIVAHPDNGEKTKALKAFLSALDISFEEKQEKPAYSPEFVAKIRLSEQQVRNGEVKTAAAKDLDSFLGLP